MGQTGPLRAGPAWGVADTGMHLASDATWDLVGTSFRIACTSAALGSALGEILASFPPATTPAPPQRRLLVVDGCQRHRRKRCAHAGGAAVEVPGDPGPLLSWAVTTVNRAAIDGFGGLAVHAGVVARGGSAVAFPAPSGLGKTTLTAAGILAGFDYVTDEALCVDFSTRQLVPYPRALALSSWSRSAVGLDATEGIALDAGEVAFPPARLGARVAVAPLELAHVVHLVRRPGPSVLVPVDRAEAVTWLLGRSFNHFKRPAESFELAAALARRSRAWHLECGDPIEAAALLLDRLG